MRSYLAVLQRPNAGGHVVWDVLKMARVITGLSGPYWGVGKEVLGVFRNRGVLVRRLIM